MLVLLMWGGLRVMIGVCCQIERQRGITVKAQTASMLHKDKETGELWLINLIDTPGNQPSSICLCVSCSLCRHICAPLFAILYLYSGES